MLEADVNRVCILGAGSGAHAIAYDLASRDFKVKLCQLPERKEGNFKGIFERGTITATGLKNGTASLELVTTDFKKAINGVKTIFVIVPSFVHKMLVQKLAPYLQDGQLIIVVSGNCGSLLVSKAIREFEIRKEIFIVETATLPFVARVQEPACVAIYCITAFNPVGVFPAFQTEAIVEILNYYYPAFVPVSNILEAGLHNPNPFLHPAPTLLNIGRFESVDDFSLYNEGMSPSVLKLMGLLMRERAMIGIKMGFSSFDIENDLLSLGKRGFERFLINMFGENAIEAGKLTKGPYSTHDRYVTEDVPYGLVLWESIAKRQGIKIPVISGIIDLFSSINAENFRFKGRTIEKIAPDLTISQLTAYLYSGKIP
jgi:opine dehydrogenase